MGIVIVATNLVLAILVPGAGLAILLRARRNAGDLLLYLAPLGLSAFALLTALVGVAGRFPTTLNLIAVDVAVVIAAGYFAARETDRKGGRPAVSLPAVVAVVLPPATLLVVVVTSMGGLAPPPGDDALVHAGMVRWFLDDKPAAPQLTDNLAGISVPEIRFGLQATAAAVARGSGLDPGRALTLLGWLSITAIPLSLLLYLRGLGLPWRISIIGEWLLLGFGLVPFTPLVLGQEPLLAGAYVIAPAAAVAALQALLSPGIRSVALAGLLTLGVVYVHPSDVITVALLTAVLLAARRRDLRNPSLPGWGALALGVVVAGALSLPAQHYTGHSLGTPPLGSPLATSADSQRLTDPRHLNGLVSMALAAVVVPTHEVLLPILALCAVALTWRAASTRALTLGTAVLLVAEADAWGWQWPHGLFFRLVPWVDPERILYLSMFVLVPLAAVGVTALAGRWRPAGAAWRERALVGGVGALMLVPPLIYGSTLDVYARSQLTGLVAVDEVAIGGVDSVVPRRSLILTDGTNDGGAWIGILSHRDTLLHKGWEDNQAAALVKLTLRNLCSARAPSELRALGVAWVYLGARLGQDGGFADRSCLHGTSALRVVPLPGTTGGSAPVLLELRG